MQRLTLGDRDARMRLSNVLLGRPSLCAARPVRGARGLAVQRQARQPSGRASPSPMQDGLRPSERLRCVETRIYCDFLCDFIIIYVYEIPYYYIRSILNSQRNRFVIIFSLSSFDNSPSLPSIGKRNKFTTRAPDYY